MFKRLFVTMDGRVGVGGGAKLGGDKWNGQNKGQLGWPGVSGWLSIHLSRVGVGYFIRQENPQGGRCKCKGGETSGPSPSLEDHHRR